MSTHHLSKFDIEQMISGVKFSADTQSHLADCTHCQNEVDMATADAWWWNEGRELIASTVKLQKAVGAAPKLIEDKGYDPIAAEVTQLTGSFDSASHPELLGRVGEYDVESLIGVGGMGAVFRAFDRELNRPIAIKFLLPRHARSVLSRQRFAREAKAIAAVSDENVIPVYRIDPNPSHPWFSMPLIEGVSLQQFVYEQGPLPPLQLVQFSKQIAAGLSAAHEKGLIHRDIKPANILVEQKDGDCGRVVVTDFGLAREESDERLTQTGMIAGTPQYMSPEQADGRKLDQRSDLFSLGSVIHFMATGEAPFHGNNQLELLKNIREAKTPAIRQHNSDIPVRLEQAIERLLSGNPDHRFQTASEVKNFFAGYEAHLSFPDSNPEPQLSRIKRSTNLVHCGIALLFTLFLALGISTLTQQLTLWNQTPSSVIEVIPCETRPSPSIPPNGAMIDEGEQEH